MLHYYKDNPLSYGKSRRSLPVKADVDIVLGMASEDCRYYGICKINPPSNLEPDEFIRSKKYLKNSLKAVLILNDNDRLTIKFDVKTITNFIKNKYFKDDLFKISEPVKIPGFVSCRFGISFNIKKGVYPVEKGTEYYQIEIEK